MNQFYPDAIHHFKDSFIATGVNITRSHLKYMPSFFILVIFTKVANQLLGLAYTAKKHLNHSDFNQIWRISKVNDDHSDYENLLDRAVCQYDSFHLYYCNYFIWIIIFCNLYIFFLKYVTKSTNHHEILIFFFTFIRYNTFILNTHKIYRIII